MLAKIRKALLLASHEGTGEAEARAAIRMAHKMMQNLNINQADVIEHESQETQAQRGGMSTVALLWRKPDSASNGPPNALWIGTLGAAMREFFNVQYYTEAYPREKKLVRVLILMLKRSLIAS